MFVQKIGSNAVKTLGVEYPQKGLLIRLKVLPVQMDEVAYNLTTT